jgi:hypothetical protein
VEETNEKTSESRKTLKVYVCESDSHEMRIARAWVTANDPKALKEGRFTDRVRLPKLAPNHVLVPILRGESASPAQTVERDPFGKRVRIVETPLKTLVSEITVRKEIPVVNHWLKGVGMDFADIFNNSFSGEVNVDSLFDAVAAETSPVFPRIDIGDPEVMRLRKI